MTGAKLRFPYNAARISWRRAVEAAPRACPPKSIVAFAYVTSELGIENSARRCLTHAGEILRGTQRERWLPLTGGRTPWSSLLGEVVVN